MLQSMRNKIKGVVAFFLIALLTIPLALVGVENLFYGNNNVGEAAEVNGKIITERDVQLALSRERQRLQSQLSSLPDEFLSDERLRGPVVEGLVQRAIIATTAEENNMRFSDSALDQAIVNVPDFQVEGQFDSQRFLQVIRNIGHTPASFRELMQENMIVEQLQNAIISSDFVTDTEIQKAIALSRQTRDFSWVTLPIGDLPQSMVVSEEEIQAYYDENKEEYLSEELVSIEYIDLQIADIEKEISIDEDQIQQQYEQVVSEFESNTEREAAHIMIEGDDDAAKDRIKEVAAKLSAGEDFSALASEYSDDFGSRDNGGNLGVSLGDAFPEDFENALLNLSEGEVSDPIEIDNATHFIKLVSVTEKVPPTYDSQKTAIEVELKRVKAEEQFIEDVQALEELAYNAETLKEVGLELGLNVNETALFSRNNPKEAVVSDGRVLEAAFSEQVIAEGHSSDVIEISPERVVVLKKLDHKPVRTLTLEEKREEILAALQLDKAKTQIAEQATSIKTALEQGQSLAEISEAQTLSLSSQVAAERNAADVPQELLEVVFNASRPSADQESTDEHFLENGDYVIFSITKVTDGNVEALTDIERASLRSNLSNSRVGDEYRAWQSELRNEADIEIYRSEYPAI